MTDFSFEELLEKENDAEIRKLIIGSIAQERANEFNLRKTKLENDLTVTSTRKNFWFGTAFVGLLSAVLTLFIGEVFGFVKFSSQNNQDLIVASRSFERDMIAKAIEENDVDQRIDALRLLVMSDLITGLTLDELSQYQQIVGDKGVPSIGAVETSLETENYSSGELELISILGTPHEVPDSLVTVEFPFEFRVDWDLGKKTNKIRFHKYGACALKRAMLKVFEHYGEENWRLLGIDRFAGSYNKRKIRGSNVWSTHAWGVAFDLFAAANLSNARAPDAQFSRPEYDKMMEIFESEGIWNRGRISGFDYKSFQVSVDQLEKRESPSSCGI